MKTVLSITSASILALTLAACGGSEEPAEPTPTPEASAPPAEETSTTPEATGAMTLEAAAAGSWRPEGDVARDEYRNPIETLEFMGIEPDDTVVEIWPGGGYYASIIAPYLKDSGKYYAAMTDPSSGFGERAMASFTESHISKPEAFGDIGVVILSGSSEPMFEEPTADYVLTFRNVHNWMAGNYDDKIFKDAYDALKPGGILGVVEHRLNSSDEQIPGAPTGYVHEDYVKQKAAEAGFEFLEASDINANPNDTKDHPYGVWTLPPNLRSANRDGSVAGDYQGEDHYAAIGESDRMTMKFVKPEASEEAESED
ncbi:MAG: hypothetical protein CMK09_03415 [Ponticaulis sp.]|nr:hypothetical protein [Ponticaulis sp.]